MSKSVLGRGLGEIFDEVTQAYEHEIPTGTAIDEIDIESIQANPYQPRKNFDEKSLKELSNSIKKHGLLQPIVVVEKIDGYTLVAGERRLRASKLAGNKQIKAVIVSVENDKLRELALIENIQREDLNPIELARSYQELIESYEMTHEELSGIINKSRTNITNTLRLLSLCEYAQQALIEGKISQGHAKVLIGIDESEQKMLVDSIVGQKLSVRDIEKIVKNLKNKLLTEENKTTNQENFDFSNFQNITKLQEFNYTIRNNKITFSFTSENEIEQFIKNFS